MAERARVSVAGRALLVVGFGLHLVAGFFVLVSGLVAPWWAVLVMLAGWAALLVLGIQNRHRPWFVLSLPVLSAVMWFVVVQGGAMIFGWTA